MGSKLVDVPLVLKEGTIDVSVGQTTLCAISTRKTMLCWIYTLSGIKEMFVPYKLRLGALTVSVGFMRQCGIDKFNTLICWGIRDPKETKK
jgi:hypothetical protein